MAPHSKYRMMRTQHHAWGSGGGDGGEGGAGALEGAGGWEAVVGRE